MGVGPSEFTGPDGKPLVPLRCQECGEQIGVQTRGASDDPTVTALCYRCAAVGEAERILEEEAG